MAQVMLHPTHMVNNEIANSELLGVTGDDETELSPPPLHFYAYLSSKIAEGNEFPSVDNLALNHLMEDEARYVCGMLRKYKTMWDR